MAKKRIFTVGFLLPGPDIENFGFNSDQTLLDADIILFKPSLGHYKLEYGAEWAGKSILDHSSSFSTKARLNHWRSEIVAAVNAGKLVVVYLVKPIEFCRFTGEKQYSGTGKSRVTTNVVADISSYEAIPNIKKVIAKSGSEMQLDSAAPYLVQYWNEFSQDSPYQVQIEGDFTRPILKSRVGDRVVGAMFQGNGTLLFLPPIQYDEEEFLRDAEEGEEEGEQYWTKEAMRFGKRLTAELSRLADALKQTGTSTPPPDWSLATNYRLALENKLEAELASCVGKIETLQAEKFKFEKDLEGAGALRALLFEQGKPLERAIVETMGLFGFDAKQFSGDGSEFDVVFVGPEGRCLGEAEGKDNKAINIDKFSQLERNLHEDFAREEVTSYAKGVLFGNAFRLQPLENRGDFFTEKCISAAKRVGVALIRTPDLFAPARYLKEAPSDSDYAKACREAIFAAVGQLANFPIPPVSAESSIAGSAKSEVQNHAAIEPMPKDNRT